jgi:hypothetical protein
MGSAFRLAVLLAAALLFAAGAAAQVTVLTHATVIDGTGAAPQPDVTIVVEDGRNEQVHILGHSRRA